MWFGEWSLATDVCAHWLGGLNDGNTDPQFKCKQVDCPYSYLPDEWKVDFDRSREINGPFGTGKPENVTIRKGKCTIDSEYFSDDQVKAIAKCAVKSYDKYLQGSFFWTAHNELEAKWDYVKA